MTELHPALQRDCFQVGRFPLCHLLLMNDASYPWCILVPDRDDISEIHQLSHTDQQQLLKESSALAAALESAFTADKINIAALGNLVPQLHVHHVVRYRNDRAWPAPVWGAFKTVPYTQEALGIVLDKLQEILGDVAGFVPMDAKKRRP